MYSCASGQLKPISAAYIREFSSQHAVPALAQADSGASRLVVTTRSPAPWTWADLLAQHEVSQPRIIVLDSLPLPAHQTDLQPDPMASEQLHYLSLHTDVPAAISSAPRLSVLRLTGPHVTACPDWLSDAAGLRLLMLSESSIVELPNGLGQLSALQLLALASCSGLTALPDTLGRLSALRELDLSLCSRLKYIPDSLGRLSALRRLLLRGCTSVDFLPRDMCELRALEELDLTDVSRVCALPPSLGRLSALQHLCLCGCTGLTAPAGQPGSAVGAAGARPLLLHRVGRPAAQRGPAVCPARASLEEV